MISWELLLEESAATNISGFRPLEMGSQGRWRWAASDSPSLSFLASEGPQQIKYRIHFKSAQSKLEIRVGSTLLANLYSAQEEEIVRGSFEIPGGEPIFLNFSFARPEGGGDKEHTFAVHEFSCQALPKAVPLLSVPASELLSSGPSPTFCSFPFVSLFLDQKAKAYPCCFSVYEANQLQGDSFEALEVQSSTKLQDAWNSPLMGSVRRQMLMGEKPSACKSCFNLEDQGVPSPRQTFALRWQELAQEQALTVNRAGEIQESPKVFDFQIGNICNLKCRMCNPTYSAGLAEEHGKIYGRDFSEERKNVWLNNSALLKALAAASSGVKELNVIGGEPMVSKEFLSLLKGLVESGESRNIFLCFNTNLTLLPPELIDLFPKFRGVRIAISLDGHGNVNDFIRFPSKFSIIEKNIHFLAENRERLAIQEISFNTTVQVYNLFGLPDLFAYLQRSFPRLAWFPVLSLLTHPVPLSVLVFPQESRRKAVVRLRKYLEELENSEWTEQSPVSRQEIQLRVESLIQYLSGEDKSALIPEFLRIHNIYDEHRGQKISFDLPGIVEHALG